MDKFHKHTGLAVPLVKDNIDTDQIMPKQFLTRIERSGFGEFVFHNWRYDATGKPNPDFVLNKKRYKNPSVLIAGVNFGCGSSREHAPWGLLDFGIKVICAESFADIFYNNCFKTGILPVEVPSDLIAELASNANDTPGYTITADLYTQTLTDQSGFVYDFTIDPFRKQCLTQGLDDIGITIRNESDIDSYEKARGI